jgi:cytidylate kinase
MAVITISREIAALGEEAAAELGRITGYKTIDREYLEKRLCGYGFKLDEQQRYDEKKPGFWSALSSNRIDYLNYLRLALFEESLDARCIIVGRGGSVIFKGIANHLAACIVAPAAVRAQRVMKLCSCDMKHARQIMEQSDHDRAGFHKIFFQVDWHSLHEYDLAINTSRTSAAQAAEMIDRYRTLAVTDEDEQAGKAQIADLFLGQKVLTEITYGKGVHIPNLSVAARNGSVTLDGISNTQSAIDRAVAAAQTVKGVQSVESAIHLMSEYGINP